MLPQQGRRVRRRAQVACLVLRIDRLANTTTRAHLPVMIWLFGGGFTNGQIDDPDFDPTGLLKSAEEQLMNIMQYSTLYW